MTERFEVHESVTRVYLTGNQEPDPRRVAVPVEDVSRIVREEVERALEECGAPERLADPYLAARFPEEENAPLPKCGGSLAGICRLPKGHAGAHDWTEDTPEARLDRLERFVTALGRYYVALPSLATFRREAGLSAVVPPPGSEVVDAAREYLR